MSFLRYSLPWQLKKHSRLPGKKSLIDKHNISKYHFRRISSRSKDMKFLMSSIKQDCQTFFPTGVPAPINFQVISPKKAIDSALISWLFVNFNKGRLKKSMVALPPPIDTKHPILGFLAHGLILVICSGNLPEYWEVNIPAIHAGLRGGNTPSHPQHVAVARLLWYREVNASVLTKNSTQRHRPGLDPRVLDQHTYHQIAVPQTITYFKFESNR